MHEMAYVVNSNNKIGGGVVVSYGSDQCLVPAGLQLVPSPRPFVPSVLSAASSLLHPYVPRMGCGCYSPAPQNEAPNSKRKQENRLNHV